MFEPPNISVNAAGNPSQLFNPTSPSPAHAARLHLVALGGTSSSSSVGILLVLAGRVHDFGPSVTVTAAVTKLGENMTPVPVPDWPFVTVTDAVPHCSVAVEVQPANPAGGGARLETAPVIMSPAMIRKMRKSPTNREAVCLFLVS